MKVGVVGAGAWGTALGLVSARGGSDVLLWSYDGEYKHFDGVTMPENLRVSTNAYELEEMDVWLLVTPSAYFRETLKNVRAFYNNQPVIICTKGAEMLTSTTTSTR